jgi:FKBP-type peptidyl-prolyl cis-trans isomerase 2|tara:strand:+ start:338 stop:1237 length:900 start_codon:yes stop_codon:yes gene_type:complete
VKAAKRVVVVSRFAFLFVMFFEFLFPIYPFYSSFCKTTTTTLLRLLSRLMNRALLLTTTSRSSACCSPSSSESSSSHRRRFSSAKGVRRGHHQLHASNSDDDDKQENDAGPDAFSGSILQDVRKGQEGFTTEMRINKGKKKTDDDSSSDAFPKLGDIVEITFSLRTSEGQILQDEDEADPVTFEVGAADVVGNPLFKAFDKAVRNMTVNETREIEASGGEYDPNLLFRVPQEHPEIERLREVWAEKGGLQEGGTVTLMNGNPAVIRSMTDEVVMLDANHPFAGSDILFDLTLRDIRANE